jgi:hypothetical protein
MCRILTALPPFSWPKLLATMLSKPSSKKVYKTIEYWCIHMALEHHNRLLSKRRIVSNSVLVTAKGLVHLLIQIVRSLMKRVSLGAAA